MSDAVAQRVLEESRKFKALLPELLKTYEGRWVVFRDGAVVEDFGDEEAAYIAGVKKFGVAGGFVVAPVTAELLEPIPLRDSIQRPTPQQLWQEAPNRAEYDRLMIKWGWVEQNADGDWVPTAEGALALADKSPLRALLYCPSCHKQHIDEGEFATRAHRQHHCVNDAAGKGCGFEWHVEPPTFGVFAVDPPEKRVAFSAAVFVYAVPGEDVARLLLIEHKLLKLLLPPGGEFQRGETPLMTAKRELLEETGFAEPAIEFPDIGLVDGMPPGFLTYEEHRAGPKGLHMNFNFCAVAPDTLTPISDGSWVNFGWYTRDQVAELVREGKTPRNVLQVADKIFEGLPR